MRDALETLVRDFGWIHTGVGLMGNLAFVAGSVLFLPQFEPWKVTGVWLFIIGSALMFVGAAGDMLVKWCERDKG
ncbi:YrhK family protein [Aurantiacibacter poecillastricola]|uniref:YrhK family protein n=1 Tax=Aurantiacibacter poecillastricola TaxID=3064385 RepID=UPI00273EBE2C|nr:YrhK family protein [Aurantiacibacter sp. 219JJ12-13]MDP5261583.1 YrhK family protein [Aurantiacibacter sp. 219JJ12-13]